MPEDRSQLTISGNLDKCTVKIGLLGIEDETTLPCDHPFLEAVRNKDYDTVQTMIADLARNAFHDGLGVDIGNVEVDWKNAKGI